MAKSELIFGELSGGGSEPLYFASRSNTSNNVYHQVIFSSNTLKKYKYIELMTAADWQTEQGTDISSLGTIPNSLLMYVNATNVATLTLGTPLDISAISIPNNAEINFNVTVSGWTIFPLKLYNE